MTWTAEHIRLALHLALGSRRFGVNGAWRERFDSIWTRPLFGFGWRLLFQPWLWKPAWRVLRLRMSIAGW